MSLIRNKKHKQLFAAFESSLIQLKLQRKTSRIAMKPIPDNMPVNLLNATTEERQLFLDSFDYVLTDCDGTVWDVDGPLEGASAAIDLLQQCGKRVVFVTNNTTRSREGYDQRFKKFQFDANFENNVMHPGLAEIEYLRSIDFKGAIFLLGTTVLSNLLTEAGFDVIQDEHSQDPIDESLSGMFHYGVTAPKASAVIVDCPVNLTFKQLIRAHILLADPACQFIVGATDEIIPTETPILGPGVLIELLEKASKRKAVVLGKPGKDLCDIIIAKYKISDRKRVLFVGDMPEQDVGFGKLCGFQTLSVLWNRTVENLLSYTNPDERADFWLPRFADLLTVLADLKTDRIIV